MAGVENLGQYINYFEIQTLCKLLNKNDDEIFKLNDVYATKILIGNKENINFEQRFHEIKSKK